MQFKLDSSGYYSSRLGLNMFSLATGKYSLLSELYFPSASIDSSTLRISAVFSVETISKVQQMYSVIIVVVSSILISTAMLLPIVS